MTSIVGRRECSGSRMRRTVWVAIVAVSLVAGVVSAVWWFRGDEVRIVDYTRVDERTLALAVDSCGAERLRASVDETDVSVRVDVRRQRTTGEGGDACADVVEVRLGQPLGSRRVIDAVSGDVVRYADSE